MQSHETKSQDERVQKRTARELFVQLVQTIKRNSWIRCHNTMVCGSGATRLGQSISGGNQRNPEERRCLVECINCCGLLRPVIGEQWRSDHDGGGLSSSKLHNHGTWLQHTLSYKQTPITRTEQVRTTSSGTCHVRMEVRIASTYVSNYVFLQLVRATYSKHACILHLVRIIHSTYAILGPS